MNTEQFRKFTLYLFLLTVLVTITGWILFHNVLPDQYFRGFLFLPLLFFGINIALHFYLIKSSQKQVIKFTPRFIGATGIKMLIYFILIAIYLLIDRDHAVSFLICFLICYLIYTAFEIVSILKYLKNKA
jgi:hypothetical protein